MSTAPIAEAAIASAATLRKRVTIDLRGLDFIDSAGISLLVRFNRAADHSPTVIAAAGPVTQLLQMCGLDRQIALMDEPAPET
jgi:anti-anti-sigma factor